MTEMQVLDPEQARQASLIRTPKAKEYVVKDRRRVPAGPKAPALKIPAQRLPTAPTDKVAQDPELGRYLKRFTSDSDLTQVEAGVILTHTQSLIAAGNWAAAEPLDLVAARVEKLDLGQFSVYMAAERARQPGRILISPRALSTKGLRRYVETLLPLALAPSTDCKLPPLSPHALAFMIGGLTLGHMDSLCAEIFSAFGYEVPKPYEPDEEGKKGPGRLSDALCTVGYGPGVNHTYVTRAGDLSLDTLNQATHEVEEVQYLRRLESIGYREVFKEQSRIDWLKAQTGSFPEVAVGYGAFSCTHADRLAKLRTKVAVRTLIPFVPASNCIGAHTLRELTEFRKVYDRNRRIDNATFNAAVRRVYERSWFELDLGADVQDVPQDIEIQMARELISALASTGQRATKDNIKISATTLLGMSLATGVPVGNLIRFAVADLKRRGDTFISSETIAQIYEPGGLIDDLGAEINVSDSYRCEDELEALHDEMKMLEEDASGKARRRWNRKLRQGGGGLWSHKSSNRYMLIRISKDAHNEDQEYYKIYPDVSLLGVSKEDLR